MRKQFARSVAGILDSDTRVVVLLGDIGVFGFSSLFTKHSTRVYNIGILEQSMVSVAAGLAMSGLIPIAHTIAPFMVERACEQLKDDFCYQGLGGNFVSVGASYDYASLGCTHHCPGDVGILKQMPDMEIVVPGTGDEFDALFRDAYANGHPTYFRLSERENPDSHKVRFGEATVIKTGARATVIAVGPMLKAAAEAVQGLDVSLLYYTTVAPFDGETLRAVSAAAKILLCEPYYQGVLCGDICRALSGRPVEIAMAGVSPRFIRQYGQAEDHEIAQGLDAKAIRRKLEALIDGYPVRHN